MPLYLPTGNAKQDLKKLPKPAIDVAADFISAIYKHALTEISKEVPEDYMAICQKEFVLSGRYPNPSLPIVQFLSPTNAESQCPPSGPTPPRTLLYKYELSPTLKTAFEYED
jgi:hypothetical protein